MSIKIIKFWKPVVWTAIIIILSSVSGSGLEKVSLLKIYHIDKVLHALMYYMQTFLLIEAFNENKNRNIRNFLYPLLIAFFTGAIMELSQHFIIESRHGDWFDLLSNVFGSVIALSTYKILYPFYYKFLQKIQYIFLKE